jgi:hypothetical protein
VIPRMVEGTLIIIFAIKIELMFDLAWVHISYRLGVALDVLRGFRGGSIPTGAQNPLFSKCRLNLEYAHVSSVGIHGGSLAHRRRDSPGSEPALTALNCPSIATDFPSSALSNSAMRGPSLSSKVVDRVDQAFVFSETKKFVFTPLASSGAGQRTGCDYS